MSWIKSAIATPAFLLILPAVLCSACNKEAQEEVASATSAPAPVAVGVLRLAPAEHAGAVRASGLVAYKRETALSFGAPGEVESLSVDVGDKVSQGQILATLRRTTTGADAGEAHAARETAEQEFERVRALQAQGFASDAALERARLAVERARDRLVLQAPASGVVLRRLVERGQIASAGAPVLWIGETGSGLVVQAPVGAEEAARLKVGNDAEVLVRNGETHKGRIARIAAKSTDAAGLFEVEIALEAAADLRSGEVGDVRMFPAGGGAAAGPGRFLIPAGALTDARADQGVVHVVDDAGVARSRAVETGGLTEDGVIVLNGLAEGDAVIVQGASMVRDGDRVAVSAD